MPFSAPGRCMKYHSMHKMYSFGKHSVSYQQQTTSWTWRFILK